MDQSNYEDVLLKSYKKTFQNFVKGLPFEPPRDDKPSHSPIIVEKNGSLGHEMSFCISDFVQGVMKVMYMLQNHHVLTDVILEVDGEEFHVHKIILASASPYFKVKLSVLLRIIYIIC